MPHADILLVDDDQDIRDAIGLILRRAGYEVRTAVDGASALAELQRQVPDLVILDIMMTTDTEGFDLAFELRDDPSYAGMPIVLLTSFLRKVRDDGPDAFQHVLGEEWPARWLFEKPIEPGRLLAKVRDILEGDGGPQGAR